LDNRLKIGDWVIVNGEDVGEVWNIYALQQTADIRITGKYSVWIDNIRIYHHELTKITKEVADIMRGV